MADLAAYARSRGLPRVAEVLSHTQLPTEAAADKGLCEPIATDAPACLKQMIRRGVESRLVRPVLSWLADRPVELGLASWDILAGSLLGPGEDAWMITLREQAKHVAAVLPEGGAQYVRIGAMAPGALVTHLTAARYKNSSEDDLLAAVTQRDLGALEELRRRGLLAPLSAKVIPAFRAFAVGLYHAHLPTLASFYLTYLYRELDDRASLAPLCEVLLDVGGIDALPSPEELVGSGGEADADLTGYVGIRSAMAASATRAYLELLDASPQKVDYAHADLDQLARSMPRSQLAHAELMLQEGRPLVPYALVTKIVAATGAPWRYGLRVEAAQAAAAKSAEVIALVDTFVAGFGNDYNLWVQVNRDAPADATWLDAIFQRLVREVTYLPHDVSVWSALAAMLKPQDHDLVDEVNHRAEWQCRL